MKTIGVDPTQVRASSLQDTIVMKVFIGSFILVLLSFTQTVPAQDKGDSSKTARRQSLYVEFLGSAFIYSLNYDRLISDHISFRVGFGILDHVWSGPRVDFFGVPVLLNYLVRLRDPHHLEFGLGIAMWQFSTFSEHPDEDDEFGIVETLSVAYRYQPRNKRLIFRIALTPFRFINDFDKVPGVKKPLGPSVGIWGGVSVGIAF